MIKTSYLRVYEPLWAFAPEEREQWAAHSSEAEARDFAAARRWLLVGAMPSVDAPTAMREGAFTRKVDGEVLICPWRTRLRMLAGLLAFRGSMPEEVADAFVPEVEARRAAHELADIGERFPEVKSHILHANWHVPLRWFAAFEDTGRILTEDKDGLRVRYETSIGEGRTRLRRCLGILESSWIEDGVTEAVRELVEWLGQFAEEGLLELDYGSVARIFSDEELLEDHSAGDVWECLDALETGDVVKAGRIFGLMTDRWTEVRAHEVVN